jgi:hypothetical protein
VQPFYHYRAFGLVFRSVIEHPGFVPLEGEWEPDCHISFGNVPRKLPQPEAEGAAYEASGRRFLLKIENVGRYLVEDGNRITIEKMPGATLRETIVFLWASAMAVLLHQRGVVIVHGSAIRTAKGAVIFSGPSGSGKSTLASVFTLKHGAGMISDDISAIAINSDGLAVVLPGYPLMKLWRDSADQLGYTWDHDKRIRDNVNKMIVDTRGKFVDQETPLRQVYLLSYKNEGPVTITEVSGFKKMELMVGKVFRKNYLKANESATSEIFKAFSGILPRIRVCTLERLHGIAELNTTVQCIEEDLRQAGFYP